MTTEGAVVSTPQDYERLDRCPLCSASSLGFVTITSRGDRFDAERSVLCGGCGLVFLTPRLTPEALARYYASDQFSREVRGSGRPTTEAMQYRDMRARRRWSLLQHRLPKGGICLEIGCGAGNFLRLLGDSGYSAIGIDPSSGYAAYARSQGLDVVVGQFPEDLPPSPAGGVPVYDLIFLFHVLEHVPDPMRMLEDVRARLAPNGVFVLEYPDVELAARRRFLPPTYFERQHLFDFSLATVRAFLGRAGMAIRETILEVPIPPYDRNVLLVCMPVDNEESVRVSGPIGSDRPREADDLARDLRRRLRISEPLMAFRPLWRFLRRIVADQSRSS